MKEEPKLRVLVVDDSPAFRAMVVLIVSASGFMEVVGEAADGKCALDKIAALQPDLVTLDVAMPVMDGLKTLRLLKSLGHDCGVVMLSAFTVEGAAETIEALGLGAFDFIAKPDLPDLKSNLESLRHQLTRVCRSFLNRRLLDEAKRRSTQNRRPPAPGASPAAAGFSVTGNFGLVAIGISTGGPKALLEMIPALPGNFPVPVVVVQHMPALFTAALAQSLDRKSSLRVVEAADGTPLVPGSVYLAPGGRQLKVSAKSAAGPPCLVLTDDPAENGCRPSADYFFRSVARVFGARAIGVIMTGMGRDGTEGLRLMKAAGATVIAQNEQSCIVFGMPMEAIKEGVVDYILPLDQIPGEIVRLIHAG